MDPIAIGTWTQGEVFPPSPEGTLTQGGFYAI